MARLLAISELDAFAKTRSIPESAISDEILTEVRELREKEQLEVWIQELIGSHDKTPHGPTIDYSQQFQNVMASFHNLFLFYTSEVFLNERTPENRAWLFNRNLTDLKDALQKLDYERGKLL